MSCIWKSAPVLEHTTTDPGPTVEAASMAVLKRYKNRKAFTGQLDDMKITGVGRRGLHLLIVLDGDSTLVVDLGSSGSLRRNANKDKVEAELPEPKSKKD